MRIFLAVIFSFLILGSCTSDDDIDSVIVIVEDEDQKDGEDDTLASIIPCVNGMAGIYPCKGFDLLANIPLTDFDSTFGNDIWGWTDTTTRKEYALLGLENGTAFIDISDTEKLIYLGKLPTVNQASTWRDIKVYDNHAYIVAEVSGHGVQVFDLTKLRDATNAPKTFAADGRYLAIGSAHNIVVNESTGFAYPVGTDRTDKFNGGVHFLDLQNPTVPILAGGWGENGYTHDAQVVSYNGPDTDYTGAEIFIGANEYRMAIVDISNKEAPVELSTLTYDNVEYTHQGWFTEDQRFFILGDELDEIRIGFKSRTLIFDLADLDNPVLYHTYLGTTNAIDHNGYVVGDEYYLANYTAGVRVLDISEIADKNVTEKAFFDTYPASDNTEFAGVWSVYPFFESGKIIISDSNNGLFVVKKSN